MPLKLAAGEASKNVFDAVLGAEVAQYLGYRVGDRIVLSHETGDVSLADHTDKPQANYRVSISTVLRGVYSRAASAV